jgi:hypothetical protein
MSEYYVSNSGNDNNQGATIDQPFRTIAKGVGELKPGDILYLRGGVYVEPVDIANKHGTPTAYIVIRSYEGEHAYIDGSLLQFRTLDNDDWEPARPFDPNAHEDEYVSTATFPEGVTNADKVVNRGAFLNRNPYTRLITYSNLNDLRSENQTFEKITDYPSPDPRPGPVVMEQCGANDSDPACVLYQDGERYRPAKVKVECTADDPDPNCVLDPDDGKRYKWVGYRRPWVYMGPGIWFNHVRDSLTEGRVHIRLSHTSNNINGLADYDEEIDPTKVKLAITPKNMRALQVRNSSYLRFENLSIRYGGEYSIHLTRVQGLVFDHVRLWASTYGLHVGGDATNLTTNTLFGHCQFNGGLPTWHFRSDHKAEYYYVDDGKIVHNILGKQSVRTLLLGNPHNTDTEIHHCEFVNAHDLYLIGQNLCFHHNWVHNLNDEGLFVDAVGKDSTIFLDMKIYQNVIVKTLSSISFAGAHEEGHWYIYRNLIDLRRPTAGFRPRYTGDTAVWRYGHFPKSNPPDGPYDLFQNTFLVYDQQEQASFMHYRSTDVKSGNHPRRSFNNIFVAVNPDPESDRSITFLPSPSFPGPTDGNDYYRIGLATKPLFRYLAYCFKDDPPCPQVPINPPPAKPPCPEDPTNDRKCQAGTFPNLDALRNSLLFEQSKSQYPPGYEAHSIEADPQFRRIGANGRFRKTDDLRLGDASPAIGAGVMLPDDLQELDPLAPSSGNPAIGCYPYGSSPLQVGVDGRRSYPSD